ncbi:MAG TPA: hypothetical protein VEW95_00895 [Candidatus Limnocylindrales bacterium]|nr:hypothetical protein [Candidatus Limnocylindrales bacterium]
MRTLLALATAMVLAGCAGGGAPTSTPLTSDAIPDVPPGLLGGGIEGLQAYGVDHVDEFGGMYIDPPGGQHVVMLFTGNLDDHAVAVEAIHPGTTLRQVEHTEAELTALIEGIDFESLRAAGVEMLSASVDVIGNRVTLEATSNDTSAEARLELAYGGLLDVTLFPVPGEWHNVVDGDGWRLIAAGESRSDAYVVRAATDAAGYADMWEEIGIAGDPPVVDPANETVVSFGHGIGSGCTEVRLDGVHIADGVVFSITSDPLSPRVCTADLVGAAVFVVAVSRDATPGGFTLWLNEHAASRADAEISASVEVDLP